MTDLHEELNIKTTDLKLMLGKNDEIARQNAEAIDDNREQITATNLRITDHKERLQELSTQTHALAELKLDRSEFSLRSEEIYDSTRLAKNSIEDLHNRLKGTDNYIEKYLPFKMVNMISDIMRPTLADQGPVAEKFYEWEERKYRSLHNVVLSDSGTPTLNKKSFFIPDPPLRRRPAGTR